ncbi:MAG: hypothetical protein LBH69_04145, partial [Methanomassiliicoccaceae archaeon]|nr:hypothetical protein [Methanomassiliicoccaceae archaeon]
MARVSDKILVAIAVAVTAMICISGSVILLDSKDPGKDINITVSSDIEDEIRTMFDGFGSFTNSNLLITAYDGSDPPSFEGNVDMIMTTQQMSASKLATGDLPAEDIAERAMVMPDGTTLVFVFFDVNLTDGIAGDLMNWALNQIQDVFIMVSEDLKVGAAVLFKEFEKNTNVRLKISVTDDLKFGTEADMLMTTSDDMSPARLASAEIPEENIGERVIIMQDGTMVFIFFVKEAQPLMSYLVDTFFTEPIKVRVKIAAGMLDRMTTIFGQFEAFTNASVMTAAQASPALTFGDADLVMTSNISTLPAGVSKIWISTPDGPVFVYFKTGADGMAGLFAEWLNAQKREINVAFPAGTGSYFETLLSGFPGTEAGLRLIPSASLSFAGADVIMTFDPDEAQALSVPGTVKKMYMAPDGTPVYLLFKEETREITDPL